MSSPLLQTSRPSGWYLNLYQDAREATGTFSTNLQRLEKSTFGENPQSVRAPIEAARRARSKVRRYCTANKLNRLGTLTYAGEGVHDQQQFRQDIGAFFKELKKETGEIFPYIWVPEWHPGGHGLHAHFAVNRFIKQSLIAGVWNKGFVHIKLLSDLPVGSGAIEEARLAASYLGKYVSKTFQDEKRIKGMHRYDIAQGFNPKKQVIYGATKHQIVQEAIDAMGGTPRAIWDSNDQDDWGAAPAFWMAW